MGVGVDRISLKLVWGTWNHSWIIPDLGFLWQFLVGLRWLLENSDALNNNFYNFFYWSSGPQQQKKHLKIPNQNYPLSVFAEKNLEHFWMSDKGHQTEHQSFLKNLVRNILGWAESFGQFNEKSCGKLSKYQKKLKFDPIFSFLIPSESLDSGLILN